MRSPTVIGPFTGKYRFLSNFYPAPVHMDGVLYPAVEHAYQASKTLDLPFRANVLGLTAGEAKRWGRRLNIRPDWNDVRLDVMAQLVKAKFTEHAELFRRLEQTGGAELVEFNTWGDVFWGRDSRTGEGENHLGRILMAARCTAEDTTNHHGKERLKT